MYDLFSAVDKDERRVYSVSELNEEIRAVLQTGFPGALWVRGEVQRLPADAARRKHVYFELHGTGRAAAVSIPVALLEWDKRKYGLQRYLDGSDPDFRLADKLEVCLQCVIDFYPPFGKLQLKVVGVDTTFTLGQLEARRRRVLAYLKERGLLDLNASLEIPLLPMRVGLVTSAGSAAERDFLAGLEESGFGFRVARADCRMMGDAMVSQVVGAVTGMARAGLDVIVITRGGGSKADLSWFDHQQVAECIARCPVPVITAIGHEIDHAIADTVAHHACKTPTAAAQDLVTRIETAERASRELGRAVCVAAVAVLDKHEHRLRSLAADLRLGVATRVNERALGLVRLRDRVLAQSALSLSRATARRRGVAVALSHAAGAILNRKRREVDVAQAGLAPRRLLAGWPARVRSLEELRRRILRAATTIVTTRARRLDHLFEKASLLDPDRLFERGYSLTCGPDGHIVRSATAVSPGDRLTTRLRGGRIESIVEGIETGSETS